MSTLHIYLHLASDEKLDRIISMLGQVIQREDKMDTDLQAIIDQAQKNEDAEAAANAALVSLFTKLEAAIAGTGPISAADRVTLQATVKSMSDSAAAVAAAIVANTPAA